MSSGFVSGEGCRTTGIGTSIPWGLFNGPRVWREAFVPIRTLRWRSGKLSYQYNGKAGISNKKQAQAASQNQYQVDDYQ